MIKITLQNVASYREATCLETDKKVNLIYGLNGSGKTTISDYLQNPDNPKFKDCSTDNFNLSDYNILVYNQKFIEENFYAIEAQKGIFTIAKENKDALVAIDNAKVQKENFSAECQKLEFLGSGIQEELLELENTSEQKTWEIKDKHTGGDRILDTAGFLDGLKGKKRTLFEYILRISLVQETKSIEEIKKEVLELQEGEAFRELLEPVEEFFLTIENDEMYKKPIVGNKDSVASALIDQLKNSDWVKRGLEYVDLKKGEQCPFCQEKTLTEGLIKSIEDCFDKTYESDVEYIKQQKNKYESLKDNLKLDNYKKEFYTEEQKTRMEFLFSQLIQNIKNNFIEIDKKINQPSQEISLTLSRSHIADFNTFIGEINAEITQYNQNQKDKLVRMSQLKEDFWKNMRKEYNPHIELYQKNKGTLDEKIKQKGSEISVVRTEIKEQESIIGENQKKITNIDHTIDEVNKHLCDFGIDYFQIEKYTGDTYRLKRKDSNGEPVFVSLSEGEKTVISFLYFVEMCIGNKDRNDIREKVVVIDDPISSLSHTYVFNIATLIKEIFLHGKESKNFAKCFILTHNLYFFHEIKPKYKSNQELITNLFRVVRGNSSNIKEMTPLEIQNDYQSYWLIIKEGEPKVVIANAMRNIIEYFFGFIESANGLNEIFNKKEFRDNKFQSFKRYIDRESHSDRMNISDYKDIDINIFKEAFQKVFESTGHEAHYKKMMDESSN